MLRNFSEIDERLRGLARNFRGLRDISPVSRAHVSTVYLEFLRYTKAWALCHRYGEEPVAENLLRCFPSQSPSLSELLEVRVMFLRDECKCY